MAKRLEQHLAQLRELKQQGPTPQTLKALETFLKEPGPVVARVAEIVSEWGAEGLLPGLAETFERLGQNGLEDDPQCWGKVAIIKSLRALGWHNPKVFILGCQTVQMEPVFAGKEDSATSLRAFSAMALAECPGVCYDQVIDVLVTLLADSGWNIRASAAKAIVQFGYPQAAPLLKLRVLVGDPEVRVIGACLDGLLALSKEQAVAYVRTLLSHPEAAIRLEAHCALAASAVPGAIQAAIQAYSTVTDPKAKKAVLAALASSPSKEALDFLIGCIGANREALQALNLLAPRLSDKAVVERVQQAANQTADHGLLQVLEALKP